MPNNNLQTLASCGQSIWYDNLSRDVLKSGELASLISEGVVGLTSNPTIFKKAIADSSDYDERIRELTQNTAISEIDIDILCEDLMVEDVREAADLLAPVFEASKGNDGFASIEVSPTLAQNSSATVAAALRLQDKINRPNIMIKIPATEAGLSAISETLANGIHVNVTLIFSLTMYKRVVESYLKGLEEFLAKGGDIAKLRSVASFFVSRVDVSTNKALEECVASGACSTQQQEILSDRIGISNSKLAYDHYLKTLASERFQKLQEKGASLQRPLWASTGTKSPELPLTYYVEALAGPDTVNTLPPATLQAVMDAEELSPKLTQAVTDAQEVMSILTETGVPFDSILDTLLQEGLSSFEDSYSELLSALRSKLQIV